MRQCASNECGLMWLDPLPSPTAIVESYQQYYTHGRPSAGSIENRLERFMQVYELLHLQLRFGYPGAGCGATRAAFARFVWWYRREGSRVFLEYEPAGKLLDVGCGSGDYLVEMARLGWEVQGLDLDPQAVNRARCRGLMVQQGTLEQLSYEPGTFDAVTLNHVIEHVENPVLTLRKCFHILKEGGQLLLFTPNSGSIGHRLFGRHWRGLEPPRHLHVFNRSSLARLFAVVGVPDVRVEAQIGTSLLRESLLCRFNAGRLGHFVEGVLARRVTAAGFSKCVAALESILVKAVPSMSDCLAAVVRKPKYMKLSMLPGESMKMIDS